MDNKELFEIHFQRLKEYMETFVQLTEKEWDQYKSLHTLEIYPPKELIICPGDEVDWCFFISKGLIKRYFHTAKGKQFIICFDAEGRIVTDYVAFINKSPATLYIEAIEETFALKILPGAYEVLRETNPIWNNIGRLVAEQRYIERSIREYNLLHYEAKERYEIFTSTNPNIVKRISQKDLAAFLSISPETLSRLKKKVSSLKI